MQFMRSPLLAIAAGAVAVFLLAILGARLSATSYAGMLSERAAPVISEAGGTGVTARFASPNGFPSRHPLLSGGESLGEATRDKIAKALAALPGVGGIRWSDGTGFAQRSGEPILNPLHCEEDVTGLLRARTIRFEEGSARIDAASRELVDEVAAALRPCLGSIISITGHTDTSGSEPGNIALSRERAQAVRSALMARGIPADGLRTRGVGSREPVEGLEPADPANRRIVFDVVATEAIQPTPVDTPGPR